MTDEKRKLTIKRYATQEELHAARPNAQDHNCGPILKYNGREFVQLYLGAHEWSIVSLDDPTEFHADPGWEGTTFGHAFIDGLEVEDLHAIAAAAAWNITPDREGKPV